MFRKLLCLIAVLIVALCGGGGKSWAEPVKASDAMNVAAFFAQSHGAELKGEEGGVAQLQPPPKQQPIPIIDPATGETLAYVVACEPLGFVVTSADTSIQPVIAYSFTGVFPTEEDPSNTFLNMLRTDMKLRLAAIPLTPANLKESNESAWHGLSGTLDPKEVSLEYIPDSDGWLSTWWHQGPPFNDDCPIDPVTNRRSIVGCAATAMAQIASFHRQPTTLTFTGDDSYWVTYDPPR